MGGYVFLTEKGKEIWRLNLAGAIVWYGLLDEIDKQALLTAQLEDHNWGTVLDSVSYRKLAGRCIGELLASERLPPAMAAYAKQRGSSQEEIQRDALRIFRGSLQKLPKTGRFIAVDDLSMDAWDEPCRCELCIENPRPIPAYITRAH